MKTPVAFASGLLFAIGLGVSGMTHPAKILAFLDFAGQWDPSLACVMGAGLLVNFVAFRYTLRRPSPLCAPSFSLPSATQVDAPLLTGAVIFGLGWGLGGFCPGPAIVSLMSGTSAVTSFVIAMLGSMALYNVVEERFAGASRFNPGHTR